MHEHEDVAASLATFGTEVEPALARIWAETLGIGVVDPDVDFFDCGGNSLLALRLVGRISSEFGVQIGLETLVEHPTVRELAAFIASETAELYPG